MSTANTTGRDVVFKVLDSMDAPYSGRILRLRLHSGEVPTVGALRGATLTCTAPDGQQASVRATGFAIVGGRPSNSRLARTGRVDLHVEELDGGGPVGAQWSAVLA